MSDCFDFWNITFPSNKLYPSERKEMKHNLFADSDTKIKGLTQKEIRVAITKIESQQNQTPSLGLLRATIFRSRRLKKEAMVERPLRQKIKNTEDKTERWDLVFDDMQNDKDIPMEMFRRLAEYAEELGVTPRPFIPPSSRPSG